MELSKKTTVLFSPELHRRLKRVAAQRGVSVGELVREACVAQYGLLEPERRRDAVTELAGLALPVGDVGDMKRQSVPDPDCLLP